LHKVSGFVVACRVGWLLRGALGVRLYVALWFAVAFAAVLGGALLPTPISTYRV